MFDSISLGRYYNTRSKIHVMNPVFKILCVLLFIVMTLISTSLSLNIFLTLFTFLFLELTKIPLFTYLKTTKILIPCYFLILIIQFLLGNSFLASIIIIIQITLVLFYIMAFTFTTSISEQIYGFEQLLSFLTLLRINVSSLALFITNTIHFLPNFIDEMNRILKSVASRGFDYRNSNVKENLLIFRTIIRTSFLTTVQKMACLKNAMILRLYDMNQKRSNIRVKQFQFFDMYLLMIHLLILIAIMKKGMLT